MLDHALQGRCMFALQTALAVTRTQQNIANHAQLQYKVNNNNKCAHYEIN